MRIGPTIVGLAALGLAACAQPDLPRDHFYRLDVPAPAALPAPRLDGALMVDRFTAVGLVAGRSIVFSEAVRPSELSEYHYHFWVEPPAVMLQDGLVAFLRAARLAETVVTPGLRREPDHLLVGRIKRLEQVTGPAPKAVVELEFALKRVKDDRLIWLESYRSEVPARDGSVAAGVEAIGRGVADIYGRFLGDVARR
jgi:cholesterol transport system auxiliary component